MSDLNGEKKGVCNDRMLINLYRHARIMGDITMDAHLVVTIHNTNTVARQASIKRFLSQRLTLF